MKKLLFILFACYSMLLLSQPKVDGLLSINEFYGKVVSKFDGEHFWVKHNSKYNIYDKSGTLVKKDIALKNQIDVRDYQNTFDIRNGIFIEYEKTNYSMRFTSLTGEKTLSGDLSLIHI